MKIRIKNQKGEPITLDVPGTYTVRQVLQALYEQEVSLKSASTISLMSLEKYTQSVKLFLNNKALNINAILNNCLDSNAALDSDAVLELTSVTEGNDPNVRTGISGSQRTERPNVSKADLGTGLLFARFFNELEKRQFEIHNDMDWSPPSAQGCRERQRVYRARCMQETMAALGTLGLSQITPEFIYTHWQPSQHTEFWNEFHKDALLYLLTGHPAYLGSDSGSGASKPLEKTLSIEDALKEMTTLTSFQLEPLCRYYGVGMRRHHFDTWHDHENKTYFCSDYAKALMTLVDNGSPIEEAMECITGIAPEDAREITREARTGYAIS